MTANVLKGITPKCRLLKTVLINKRSFEHFMCVGTATRTFGERERERERDRQTDRQTDRVPRLKIKYSFLGCSI